MSFRLLQPMNVLYSPYSTFPVFITLYSEKTPKEKHVKIENFDTIIKCTSVFLLILIVSFYQVPTPRLFFLRFVFVHLIWYKFTGVTPGPLLDRVHWKIVTNFLSENAFLFLLRLVYNMRTVNRRSISVPNRWDFDRRYIRS